MQALGYLLVTTYIIQQFWKLLFKICASSQEKVDVYRYR